MYAPSRFVKELKPIKPHVVRVAVRAVDDQLQHAATGIDLKGRMIMHNAN